MTAGSNAHTAVASVLSTTLRLKDKDSKLDGNVVQVIDCEDWNVAMMKQGTFFKKYQEDNEDGIMYKLKDWPPNAHFRERLGRHNQVIHPSHSVHPPSRFVS